MNQDLTVGKPSTVLLRFCVPLMGSVLFQQLYNLADSWVAGVYIGENALAAVGNSYELTLIFLAFAFGCNTGCSVVTAQLFGAQEHSRMKTAVYTALLSSGALCLALMALGALFSRPLLMLIRTPTELLADSALYLDIYILGLPFLFFYNLANGIFSALGDSKTPFYFLACSSTANIAVDILFVRAFHMGVAGVAWATFLCQGVSCVLAMTVVLRRFARVSCSERPALFSWPLLGRLVSIAIPTMLQQSFVSVGNIIIQWVINGFGPAVIAGYAAAVKLNNLVITSFTTLGNGVSSFSAQNIGAKAFERVRAGLRAGLRLVWTLCVPVVLLYFLGAPLVLRAFMREPSALSLSTGITFLRILSPFYFVISAKLSADGVLRGAGRMKPFMVSTFTDLILRTGLAIVLARTTLGATGIWMAWPLGWTVATVLSLIGYLRGPWMSAPIEPER